MAEVDLLLNGLKSVFDGMKVEGPKPLMRRLVAAIDVETEESRLEQLLITHAGDRSSQIREELHARLTAWDYDARAKWTETEPNTEQRRAATYLALKLSEKQIAAFDAHLPPRLSELDREVVITDEEADTWYTREFLRDREFYWPRYREYLKSRKKLPEETLVSLDEAASRVVESLAPPHSKQPRPRRGLVVGYVQSGKTTNFTAVIAKAVDAGYRLIIVLAGTIDLLRLQTQRRLDMELVGVENIGADPDDFDREYANDPSYPSKFISYGVRPREIDRPNIKRLTSSTGDFRSIDASFQALAFDELGGKEKAWEPSAIKKTNVRLIVIKKVTARLKKLVKEIKSNKEVREHLPALVIDDESDQASVNTVNPDKAFMNERSKTNAEIVKLLQLLPRAQYVGYTATPFANVLVDPTNADDIFPRDFIVSLPRPEGYMGVRDFHDLESPDGETPNKDAHVRPFDDGDSESLCRAMDSFVVSGALKLFREAKGVQGDFRHHTMMIHRSVSNAAQFELADEVERLWRKAGYGDTGDGPARLKRILEGDFRITSHREPKLPFPKHYDELKPFVSKALDRIRLSGKPVIVVNGHRDGEDPAFDTTDHVWRIIIGGAKLSRGYTVEGLTITYFSRVAKAQDTMMQMGRWFGYRTGYRDLVRLFLQRGADDRFDLYDAFESICRDEERFREQLKRYARPSDGTKAIRPIQVPAVVYNSFPGLTRTRSRGIDTLREM